LFKLSLTEEIVCPFSLKQTMTVFPKVVADILTVIVVWEPELAFCAFCIKEIPGGMEGERLGLTLGDTEADGLCEGETDGLIDGLTDGETEGLALGEIDGETDGETEGLTDGDTEALGL
jgi:hypothetical protein